MIRRLNPLALGVFGVFVMVAGSYLAFTKRVPLVEGYRVVGVFQSSNQLIQNSPVRIAGVDVGKVIKVDDGPGSTREVTMELGDSGRPVHADATLRIRPRLFLEGGFYIELRPGSPSGPEIKDGGTIPLGQTSTPVQFHQVLTALNKPTRSSLRTVIDETFTALDEGGAEALGAVNRPLKGALRDGAIVAEAARGVERHDLSGVIQSAARVTGALASRRRELADLVTNLSVTTGALAAEDRALAATLRELDGVLREAPAALDAIDTSLPPLRRFAVGLRPSLRDLPPTLTKTVALLRQLRLASRPGELPALISKLRPALAGLPLLVERLTGLFPLVTPVTDCVRTRAIPVLNAKLDDGALSTNQPVWRDLASGAVGLASSTQNFDANGFATRYLVGLGDETVATGSVPGVGTLFGSTGQEIAGSRPQWFGPGVTLPFRPDQACRDQAAPNLGARAGGALAMKSRRVSRAPRPVSLKSLTKVLRKPRIRRGGAFGGKVVGR